MTSPAVAKVFELADLMPVRLRALVLLATFASLRWGEVAALRRMDLDLAARTVSVRQQHVELDTGELLVGPPKSRAGARTVAIPEAITRALRDHLDQFTEPEADALIFTGSRGGILRRSNFRRAAKWDKSTRKINFSGLHFHDLRHTGNTIAASSGASLKDPIQRMGRDSVRAALIYQHSTAEADRQIANAMNASAQERRRSRTPASIRKPTPIRAMIHRPTSHGHEGDRSSKIRIPNDMATPATTATVPMVRTAS